MYEAPEGACERSVPPTTRKSVQDRTWRNILARLETPRLATPPRI